MARVFSFASWNIEHFAGRQDRFDRVVDELLVNGPPQVFGIFEVQSSTTVFNEFTSRMPDYQFFITVTPRSPMDTLIGVHRDFTAFYEQRNELTAGMPTLRPGALVTIQANNTNYTLLFVHLKAMDKPLAWGLRDDMVYRIRNLKKALDNAAGNSANFIALGDYNAVGMNLTYSDKDIDDAEELARYEDVFRSRDLRLIPKDYAHTFCNGSQSSSPPADMDHVFASEHLDIRYDAINAGISVKGWPEWATDAEKDRWIELISDHAMLYGEVHD